MSQSADSKSSLGAIVLSGGLSQRMGYPKWKLPLNGRTMLDHIVQSISSHVSHVVVASGSETVEINWNNVDVVCDQNQNCGPLEGIRVGLEMLADRTEFAFVTACDTPFYIPAVVDFLFAKIDQYEAVIPTSPSHVYGMTGVYRNSSHEKIDRLIQQRKLRVSELATALDTLLVPTSEIRQFDPELRCIYNINRPTDYFELLELHGQECTEEVRLKLLSSGSGKE